MPEKDLLKKIKIMISNKQTGLLKTEGCCIAAGIIPSRICTSDFNYNALRDIRNCPVQTYNYFCSTIAGEEGEGLGR
jgi:hypothetical protein